MVEITQRMSDAGLAPIRERLTPVVLDIITSETRGYLSVKDMRRFDKELDNYLNANFFIHERSGKMIVEGLVNLKRTRQTAFRRLVLDKTLAMLDLLQEEPELCGPAFFRHRVRRPWGQHGEDVDCYAFRIEAVFDGLDPDANGPRTGDNAERQPAVADLIDARHARLVSPINLLLCFSLSCTPTKRNITNSTRVNDGDFSKRCPRK